MKVIYFLIFAFIVFVIIITDIIQCIDVMIPSEGVSGNRRRIFNIKHLQHSPAYTQNTVNYKMTEDVCFKCDTSGTYKFLCLFVSLAAIVPIRMLSRQKCISKFNRYRVILNTICVGVISTDSKNNITYMNKSAGKMCGWSPELAIGKPIDDVVQFETKNLYFDDLQNFNVTASNLKDFFKDKTALGLQNEERSLDIQLITSPLPLSKGIAGNVIVLLDVTSTHAQVKELSYRAAHDALTGLPNRDSFERYLRNATTKEGKHAIVYVDLDGFKTVNDTAGHAAGDALLIQVAKLMTSQIRHTDFVARLGGDEFGLILFNCGLQQAKALMNVIVQQINDYQFCWEGEVLHFGASVGITTIGSRKDLGVILSEADTACYEAKRRGKGQVCVYTGCE